MKIGERIINILKDKNLTQKGLADHVGIRQSTISDWKGKGTNPSSEYILKISEYLNESPYFILTGKNDISKFTDEEINLLNKYNLLTDKNKGRVENFVDERLIEQDKGKSCRDLA